MDPLILIVGNPVSIIQNVHTITSSMDQRIRDGMILKETGDTVLITQNTIKCRSPKRSQNSRLKSATNTPPSTTART